MTDLPGYAAAQRAWENMLPPEDGPSECQMCNGSGYEAATEDHEGDSQCDHCDGYGWLTADGEPHDPHADEREACERADRERDERLTNDGAGGWEHDE